MEILYTSRFNRLALLLIFLLAQGACTPPAKPVFFLPPTESVKLIPNTPVVVKILPTTVPTIIIPTPTPVCSNDLTYLQDLTIPDGTNMPSGQSIDKQWLVRNSGSCNWDSRYKLKLISGDAMGAPAEQALYPALAGTQAKLRILFIAPDTAGTYQSAWQAEGPDGVTFGAPIYIQITVGP